MPGNNGSLRREIMPGLLWRQVREWPKLAQKRANKFLARCLPRSCRTQKTLFQVTIEPLWFFDVPSYFGFLVWPDLYFPRSE
jgi:hypothetical protein